MYSWNLEVYAVIFCLSVNQCLTEKEPYTKIVIILKNKGCFSKINISTILLVLFEKKSRLQLGSKVGD